MNEAEGSGLWGGERSFSCSFPVQMSLFTIHVSVHIHVDFI